MNNKKREIRVAPAWLTAAFAVCTYAALSACGGSDSDAPPNLTPAPAPAVPPGASAMATRMQADMARSVTRITSLEAGSVFAVVPGVALAPNIVGAPDTSPGSPPNTWTFRGTYDGNANGQDETTLDGRITFVNDPADLNAGFNGAQGSVTVAIDIPGLQHVYRGNLSYTAGMSEHRVGGDGTFTNPLTGITTTMTIDRNAPLRMKLADGGANAQPNACAHSLDGLVQFSVVGATGTLSSQWSFAYGSPTASVDASFTDTAGNRFALPASQLDVGCTSTASTSGINDWSGRYVVRWACLPRESGEFTTTITALGSTSLRMIDDGDTAADAYQATQIGTSARAVRGFFIDGPAGSRYREDFNWTLNLDGSGFSETSRYVYFEGPQAGRGGVCAGRATRI